MIGHDEDPDRFVEAVTDVAAGGTFVSPSLAYRFAAASRETPTR